jgi:hypothetical protein
MQGSFVNVSDILWVARYCNVQGLQANVNSKLAKTLSDLNNMFHGI